MENDSASGRSQFTHQRFDKRHMQRQTYDMETPESTGVTGTTGLKGGKLLVVALLWLGLGLFNFAYRNDPSPRSFDHYGWIGYFSLSALYFFMAYRQREKAKT